MTDKAKDDFFSRIEFVGFSKKTEEILKDKLIEELCDSLPEDFMTQDDPSKNA